MWRARRPGGRTGGHLLNAKVQLLCAQAKPETAPRPKRLTLGELDESDQLAVEATTLVGWYGQLPAEPGAAPSGRERAAYERIAVDLPTRPR